MAFYSGFHLSVQVSNIMGYAFMPREIGSLAPLPRGGWARVLLNEEHLLTLAEMAARQPDATLEELRQQLRRETKPPRTG